MTLCFCSVAQWRWRRPAAPTRNARLRSSVLHLYIYFFFSGNSRSTASARFYLYNKLPESRNSMLPSLHPCCLLSARPRKSVTNPPTFRDHNHNHFFGLTRPRTSACYVPQNTCQRFHQRNPANPLIDPNLRRSTARSDPLQTQRQCPQWSRPRYCVLGKRVHTSPIWKCGVV